MAQKNKKVMEQLGFFDPYQPLQRVVNVSSVPQRSPFRYPGGKTWLIPQVRNWLKSQQFKPALLIEPFAGGAIVGLTAAAENLVDHIILVELDQDVAAVWKTIIHGDAEWLANRIVEFDFNMYTIEAVLKQKAQSPEEHAFQTILRNRISHGGILAPGAGFIKNGENGRGISSRWYPQTLKQRILKIAQYKDRITFLHDDGLAVLQEYSSSKTVSFIDPPYTASGKKAGLRLYAHNELDHDALFQICQNFAGDFLMTYENSDGMQKMAEKYGFQYKSVAMNNTHHAKLRELIIGRNLDWAGND